MKKLLLLLLSASLTLCLPAFPQDDEERDKALSLNQSAINEYNSGNYAEAIRLGTEALGIWERMLGKENPDYAISLNNLATYNDASGNRIEAIRLGTEALKIQERVLGKEHPDYATSLSNLASYYDELGNYAEAVHLGTEALEIQERALGKEHPDYATSLSNLTSFNEHLGNYSEAIRLGTEALKIQERVLGKENTSYAASLNNLATCNAHLGNSSEAIRFGTEALGIIERVLGKEHPLYATSLSNLAGYYDDRGNYTEAIRIGTEAMEIRERVLGTESTDYATSLNTLASYNSDLGNYAEAVRLGTEALEIRGKVLGKEHPAYATSLSNLAGYYDDLGNYAEAVRLGTETLEIRESVLGKEHPDYASSLNNLAKYNYNLGNYAEAVRLGTEALEIRGKVLGKEHPAYATSLDNLAAFNSDLGNHAEAVRLGTEALEIRGKALGKENPDYAVSLNNLAGYTFHNGNFTEAARLGAEALEARERALGKEHPLYATSLSNLAIRSFYCHDYDTSAQYSVRTTQVYNKIILRTFADLTASERALFWSRYSNWYKDLPGLAFYIHNDSLTATAYDGTLLSKGLLLNSETEMSKLLLESGDTAVVSKYHALQGNRAVLNKLYEKPIAERRISTDSLESVIKAQEQELVRLSKVYGDYTKNLSIGWREVQARLGEKDAAVEFLSFGARNDSVMYVALTLTKEDDVPHLVPLFEEKELDSIAKGDYYTTSEISRLVWQPLKDVLRGKRNIYFAPAGELHNIAIESVPSFEGEGLMSESWSLYRLSSTRELALIKDRNELRSACLYGDLSYDMSLEDIVENEARYASANTKRGSDWEVASIADSLSLRGAVRKLPPLPGTKAEVESVDRSLRSQGISSALLTDTAGTEASFKALNGRRTSILHLATHGFYWTESEARRKGLDAMSLLSNDNNAGKYVEDKMLTRSGLFLAGADKAFDKSVKLPEGVDDGILTAKEISTLDLRGLDLVVLSACETGLGEIKGDGVFGLQRGFKKAGANTLVMSLWQVADKPTQELMSQFYQDLAQGMAKYEAFRKAQGYLRDKYPEPEYWAAFILLDAVD